MENKLTHGSNLLWSSSRIILPEHREAILQHREKAKYQTRPILDDQKKEEIARRLLESYTKEKSINVVIYGKYGNSKIHGIIEKWDPYQQQIKINGQWILLKNILDVN